MSFQCLTWYSCCSLIHLPTRLPTPFRLSLLRLSVCVFVCLSVYSFHPIFSSVYVFVSLFVLDLKGLIRVYTSIVVKSVPVWHRIRLCMHVGVRMSVQSFTLYVHAYLFTWFVHSSIWNLIVSLCLCHISLCAFFLYSLSQYFTLFACLSMSSFLSFVLVITFLFLSFLMCVCLWYPFPFVITYLFVDLLMCCCCLPPSSLRHAQWRCRISEIIFLRQIASSSQRLTLTYFNFSSQCVTNKHFFLVGFLGAA